ncbi:hypothetical protein MLD38_006038 [Melastoma candidum]|uniref:Uncharacterized protein n=1 Tax=Melastoma candidum TaxID=119954 RepID=A0ACB9RLB1_9MYRT|nr:hypothetical protein MLD38_006038 [Melastoma candidum]
MGRLGKTPSTSTTPATELDQPDHLPQAPPPTTASDVVTSCDPPGNNASDSVSPIDVPPERNNQEQLPLPPLQHPEEKDRTSEIVEVVEFPPRTSITVEARLPLDPDKQMVVYVPPGDNMIPPTGGRPLNGQEEVVMFPPQKPAKPVHVQPNVIIPGENVLNAANAGNQQQKQPPQNQKAGTMPPVILVPFIGVPWHSGLFDCCQQPTNGMEYTSDLINQCQL